MKKMFAMLMLVLAAVLVGAETKPRGFSAQIIPTRAVNIADQFTGILPARPPFFPKVSKVICGEPFALEIIFIGAKVRNGAIELAGKLTMSDPKGKKTEIPLRRHMAKVSGDTAGVFLFPQSLKVIYEPQDPRGKCSFELELTDCHAEKTVKASASVEYMEKVEPEREIKAFDKIAGYYRAPCPEYIIPAFREFLANLPKQKAKEKRNFNPLPQLAFFYFALKENPQCVPEFAKLFKSLQHNEEKYLAAVVLDFASGPSAKALNPNQRKAIGQQFPSDPFQFEKAAAPWQLDVCWAEFFVRGTKAPVMKVVNALTLANDSVSIADYKKLASPTREDQRKLMNGLTAMAAQWSLNSLAKTHPLIRFYVEAALVRGEVKDPVAAALAAKAVGMQIKLGKKQTP